MSTPDLESRLRHELDTAAGRVAADTQLPGPLRACVQRRRRRHVLVARSAMVVLAVAVVAAGALRVGPRGEPEPIGPAGATDRIDDPVELSFEVEMLPASPLGGRLDPSVVWTGTELLVWGGSDAEIAKADGAAYDPRTRTWRVLAPAPLAPRTRHTAVWTGAEMIVAGGAIEPFGAGDRLDAAAYAPATDTWRSLPPIPAGAQISENFFAGGRQHAEGAFVAGRVVLGAGMSRTGDASSLLVLDPSAPAWEVIDLGAQILSVAPAGDRVVVSTETHVGDGIVRTAVVLVDPVTGELDSAPPLGEASGYRAGTAVWTGERVVVGVVEQPLGGNPRTHILAWAPGQASWTPTATTSSDDFSPDYFGIDPGAARWVDGWLVSRTLRGLLQAVAPSGGSTVQLPFDRVACGASAGFALTPDAAYVIGGQRCDGEAPGDVGDAVATAQVIRFVTD